jgi:hypothetical protein
MHLCRFYHDVSDAPTGDWFECESWEIDFKEIELGLRFDYDYQFIEKKHPNSNP